MTNIFEVNDFKLYYSESDNGGGTSIGLDFKNVLNKYHPGRKFARCLEWCSGPGFIGFDLLLNNYCKELTLVDRHQPALDSAIHSVDASEHDLKVNTYCLDQISKLPEHEKFDLVVANPPHFSFPIFHQDAVFKNEHRIYLDKSWQIHKEFFANIYKHLNPEGVIILQESSWACNHNTFDIFLHNLQVSNYYSGIDQLADYPIFYLELTHK